MLKGHLLTRRLNVEIILKLNSIRFDNNSINLMLFDAFHFRFKVYINNHSTCNNVMLVIYHYRMKKAIPNLWA